MSIFDTLIDDMAQRFGLGANAGPLVREALTLITGSQGGIGGFLNLFKTAGLSSDVASWVGHSNAAPLAAQQIEKVLGASALGGIASRLGLGQAAVSTALGYAVPKLIGLLTPNGVVPTSVPAEVTNFLSPPPIHRVAKTTIQRPAAPVAQTAQVAPRRIDVYPAKPAAHDEPTLTRWLWPLLAALAVLGLRALFLAEQPHAGCSAGRAGAGRGACASACAGAVAAAPRDQQRRRRHPLFGRRSRRGDPQLDRQCAEGRVRGRQGAGRHRRRPQSRRGAVAGELPQRGRVAEDAWRSGGVRRQLRQRRRRDRRRRARPDHQFAQERPRRRPRLRNPRRTRSPI